MRKISDFEDKERRQISSEVDALASEYDTDKYDGVSMGVRGLKNDMGLCGQCKDLLFTKTQYGTQYAKCTEWKKNLNGVDLVVECTAFRRRGEMSLYDMKDIAIIIETPKRKIGII